MCGVVSVFNHPEAAKLTHLCLYALQHRGTESTGIVTSYGNYLYSQVGLGRVNDFFTQERLDQLPGSIALGHNRYSTTGESTICNAQPLISGHMAIAHNGNLTNATALRAELMGLGSLFHSSSDTEVILQRMKMTHGYSFLGRFMDVVSRLQGAYSLVIMNETEIIVARDPHGFRPLCLGERDGSYIVVSEPCALDVIDATYIRDICPGEVLRISSSGLQSYFPLPIIPMTPCIFELIYFSRPDSTIFGQNVHEIRKSLGRQLARETKVEADIVIPVPDSGIPAALGYAQESGIPFETGLVRSHYSGRSFIEPEQSIRDFKVKIKFNPIRSVLEGKRVVVVDDSIVRGTTSQKLVRMLRRAGVKEIHFRVSSPPVMSPCFFGIDMPTRGELIASNYSVEEIREFLQADSLAYLSHEGMMSVVKNSPFCSACFTGKYPVKVDLTTHEK